MCQRGVRELEQTTEARRLLDGPNLAPLAHEHLLAVAAAVAAHRHGEAALREPSLLPTGYFSDDETFMIYAPLFLPIATALVSAWRSALRVGPRP